jgi:hypothetical protein
MGTYFGITDKCMCEPLRRSNCASADIQRIQTAQNTDNEDQVDMMALIGLLILFSRFNASSAASACSLELSNKAFKVRLQLLALSNFCRLFVARAQAFSHMPVIGHSPKSLPKEYMNSADLGHSWRRWALEESAKRYFWISHPLTMCLTAQCRARLMLHLHDWGRSTYHGLQPCSNLKDSLAALVLPCESELWEASDAVEWSRVLHAPSPYGDCASRLRGYMLKDVMDLMHGKTPPNGDRVPPRLALYFAFFFFIGMHHAIDCDLFTEQEYKKTLDDADNVLTRWFSMWTVAAAHHPAAGFLHDGLPVFLVRKAMIYYARQGYNTIDNNGSSERLRRIMSWYRHIRIFLDTHDEITPEIWTTLPLDGLEQRNEVVGVETTTDSSAPCKSFGGVAEVSADQELQSMITQMMTFKIDV